MATMSNAGASFEEPHNVVHNDIACFSVAGHAGHMGDLNWSGFDPIFMLHHANIDRLYAMWQAINFNDPVFTTSQHGNALYGTASGPMTADSPLRPFFAPATVNTNAPVFYTSRSVEAMSVFGYTYPEIDDWSLAPGDLANTLRIAVNNLYGPGASSATASKKKREAKSISSVVDHLAWKLPRIRRARAASNGISVATSTVTTVTTIGTAALHPAAVIPNARVLDTNDYSIEVGVDRSQLPLPCTIELHLAGGVTRHPVRIGSTSILSMPQTGISYSTTPLRRVLVGEATRRIAPAVFNDNDDVLACLRSLGVVIKTPDGHTMPVASVSSLTMTVQKRSYTPLSADNQFPQYGPVTPYSLKPQDLVL